MANQLEIFKVCRICKESKPIELFSIHTGNKKPKRYCKQCAVLITKNYVLKSPLSQVKYNLKKKYDLSLEEYFSLLEGQKNRCAICENSFSDSLKRRLNVDHCHETGKVRGLLCFNCNTALGKFNDDINLLINALNYLQIRKD